MDYEKLYQSLRNEFPEEALHIDRSRGQKVLLVGAKIGWVVDWLNNKLGMCGYGWRFVYSNPEVLEDRVRVTVLLQYRVKDGDGVPAYYFNEHGAVVTWNVEKHWSEPIISVGEQKTRYDAVGDAVKGAVSHGISKAASYIGVALENYMGMWTVEDDGETIVRSEASNRQEMVVNVIMALSKADPETAELLRADYDEVNEVIKKNYHLGLYNFYVEDERLREFYEAHEEEILGGKKLSELTIIEVMNIYHALSIYAEDEDMAEEDLLSVMKNKADEGVIEG